MLSILYAAEYITVVYFLKNMLSKTLGMTTLSRGGLFFVLLTNRQFFIILAACSTKITLIFLLCRSQYILQYDIAMNTTLLVAKS